MVSDIWFLGNSETIFNEAWKIEPKSDAYGGTMLWYRMVRLRYVSLLCLQGHNFQGVGPLHVMDDLRPCDVRGVRA